MRVLCLAASLCVFWFVASGEAGALLLAFMVASCFVVVVLAHRFRSIDAESYPVQIVPRAIRLMPWLLVSVFRSSLRVARLVFASRTAIRPAVRRLPATQRGALGLAIHANTVTMMPGTITLEVGRDSLVVHALAPRPGFEDRAAGHDARISELCEGAS